MTELKPFLSDNAAPVHPAIWEAMRAADAADTPYDGDALSAQLDARFTDLFGRECAGLWVATGTAANCLALATMCQTLETHRQTLQNRPTVGAALGPDVDKQGFKDG